MFLSFDMAAGDWKAVFVIDALDECEDANATASLMRALISISQHSSSSRIKFLVTSRPEKEIRDVLASESNVSRILRLHSVEPDRVTGDIRLYIQTRFTDSLLRHGKPSHTGRFL